MQANWSWMRWLREGVGSFRQLEVLAALIQVLAQVVMCSFPNLRERGPTTGEPVPMVKIVHAPGQQTLFVVVGAPTQIFATTTTSGAVSLLQVAPQPLCLLI